MTIQREQGLPMPQGSINEISKLLGEHDARIENLLREVQEMRQERHKDAVSLRQELQDIRDTIANAKGVGWTLVKLGGWLTVVGSAVAAWFGTHRGH